MTVNDTEQLKQALQSLQQLYMKLHKRKECVHFYVKYIQPIYKEINK